jgi:transcriptional regulator with XRE-family HTH domain
MASAKDELKRLLEARPELREKLEREAPLRELQTKMILARQKAGLSQAEVAKRMGTNRTTVTRLESVNNDNWPTLDTIRNYAAAVGCKFETSLVAEVEGEAEGSTVA